jgi:hypothetical protein
MTLNSSQAQRSLRLSSLKALDSLLPPFWTQDVMSCGVSGGFCWGGKNKVMIWDFILRRLKSESSGKMCQDALRLSNKVSFNSTVFQKIHLPSHIHLLSLLCYYVGRSHLSQRYLRNPFRESPDQNLGTFPSRILYVWWLYDLKERWKFCNDFVVESICQCRVVVWQGRSVAGQGWALRS